MTRNNRRYYAKKGQVRIPVVYTDGACSLNGREGAKSGIGVYWGRNDSRNVSEPLYGRQTNNRAEIAAATRAILQAKKYGFSEVEIRTDSMFVINSVTKWINKWLRNNWTTVAGHQVVNRRDFEAYLGARKGIAISWTHVDAHSGIRGNVEADRLARAGMNDFDYDNNY